MDMPEGGIGQAFVERIRADGFQTAHNGALAPVVFRQFGSRGVQVSHCDKCLSGLPLRIGIFIELAVHPGNTCHIGIFSLIRSRIISLPEIRHSKAKGFPLPFFIIQGYKQRVKVDLAQICPGDNPDN